jgi:hypothetical protein
MYRSTRPCRSGTTRRKEHRAMAEETSRTDSRTSAARTPFESILGERPEVILRRAATQIGRGMANVIYSLPEPVPGERWEMPLSVTVPHVEHIVQDYTPRELVTGAAAWAVRPEQLAADLLVELRSCGDVDVEPDDEDRYRALAEHTAERWRAGGSRRCSSCAMPQSRHSRVHKCRFGKYRPYGVSGICLFRGSALLWDSGK